MVGQEAIMQPPAVVKELLHKGSQNERELILLRPIQQVSSSQNLPLFFAWNRQPVYDVRNDLVKNIGRKLN